MATTTPSAETGSGRDNYKWIALSNTTLGILMVTINTSILLISLPSIFRGIDLQPLAPGNTSYFLWILMGFLLVTAVLVVSFGRVGDMYGRVRMYNLGFAIFTLFSILLSITWMSGPAGALWIIFMRFGQGVGGAFLFANSSAIVTDAFPENERGKAMGINGVALVTGSFLGLILGGVLAPIEWRLVFLVSVPFGLFGTVWAYLKLKDNGVRIKSSIDWIGNVTFALGLIALLTGIVYGIQPYGGHTMGWTSPFVLGTVFGGLILLVVFVMIEMRVDNPMIQLHLFRIRAYTAGVAAMFLSALGRGGLQFILIIWLQGIWLPQHGYNFSQTPLWAGIYMIPLTVGFLVSGPVSGIVADRYGARGIATVGLVGAGCCYLLLELLPMDFSYVPFAVIILLFSLFSGMFFSPNQMGVMNSLPPDQRGAGAGMNATFMNSAQVLSIGVFFSIITLGLAASLPADLYRGLVGQGVPVAYRQPVRCLPGVQPHQDRGSPPGAGQPRSCPGRLSDRSQFLSEADLALLRRRSPPGFRLCCRHQFHRRRRLVAARRKVPVLGGIHDRRGGGGAARSGGAGLGRGGRRSDGRRLTGRPPAVRRRQIVGYGGACQLCRSP
jgi:MFS family permease